MPQGARLHPSPFAITARQVAGVPPVSFPPRPKLLNLNPLVILVALVVFFAAILLVGLYAVTARPVAVVIEGVRRDVRTNQATVAGLLSELAVLIEPPDVVSPPADTPIVSGLVVTIDKAQSVAVEVDGEIRRTLTHQTQPRDILNEIGVEVNQHDAIYVDGLPMQTTAYPETPRSLRVVRAIALTLDDGGARSTFYTIARTVGQALRDVPVSLYLADRITPGVETPVEDGDVITIERSIPFSVQVEGRTLETRTHGKTVGEALAEVGIALFGLDYAIPDESAPITAHMTVRIVRVVEEDEIERLEIDFSEEIRTDTNLPPETQKIIQEGAKGVLERRIRIRREDGIEVSRSAPQETILREPQNRIIAIGATPALLATPTPASTQSGS